MKQQLLMRGNEAAAGEKEGDGERISGSGPHL